jgi:hypothetical protein
MPASNSTQTGKFQRFDWPLIGKLRIDVDPMLIGEGNFRSLINMRYASDCPRGIQGMTPINVSPLAYKSIVNGFHFRKDQPPESHVFVQANSGASSALFKSNNVGAVPTQDTFASFQALENTNTVFFSDAPNGALVALNGTSNRIWPGNEDRCAQFVVYDDAGGTFWYDYTDKVNNTLDDASNVATMTGTGGVTYAYIASVRPLKGVKFYVKTPNASGGTITGEEWNGTAWVALAALVDNTAALSATGSVTFTSTVATSKIKSVKRSVAYFYKFAFTGIDNTTTVYRVTLDAPMQPILDIWDGFALPCLQFFMYTTTYTDYTINVAAATTTNPKSYQALAPYTYAQLGGMTSSQYLYAGFAQRVSGIEISLPDALYVNTASETVTIEYWDGSAWVDVGTLDDGTLSGGKSFNHSGLITWNAIPENTEFQTTVANEYPFYYYRISFSGTLSSDVRVDNIGGVTAQRSLKPYKFSQLWQGRIWLFNDMAEKKNTAICSAYGTNCVFNGDDSVEREFGDDKEIMCADSLFTRYGSNLYDNMVVLKRNATFLVDGFSPSSWVLYQISNTIGCLAPLTLKRCDMGYEVAQGLAKHVLIWRSAGGIQAFDGNTILTVSDDIRNFFDSGMSEYIDPLLYDTEAEAAFYDAVNTEYHWIFTNVNGEQEWVYDLKTHKWFQVDRGDGKYLTCGFRTGDSVGNNYVYGGTSDGFIELTEDGTTFDGNPITYTFWFGDILLAKTGDYVTKLRHMKIIAKAKNISTATVSVTHYGDTAITGTSFAAISQKDGFHRLYQARHSINENAVLHGLKYEVTTNNEVIGFEPLMVSGLFDVVREDL